MKNSKKIALGIFFLITFMGHGALFAMQENGNGENADEPTTPRDQVITDEQILNQRFDPANEQLINTIVFIPAAIAQTQQYDVDELKKKSFFNW